MKRFSLLSLFFLLLSCGKGVLGPARVDGVVADATTGDPIYNATVYLFERENDFEFLGAPAPEILIDSTTTGALGRFEFAYDDRHGYAYSVFATKYNYIDKANPQSILSLGNGTDIELILDPEAFLKVRIHNIKTYDSGDYIGINGLDQDPYYGNDVDTIEIKRVAGNSTATLHVFIYNNGINDGSVEHNIYCPAFDTTYYEILY